MKTLFFLLLCSFPLLFPQQAEAHAFGTQYTLALPVWLYLYGAGAAIIVSFLLIGYFINLKRGGGTYPTKDITRSPIVRFFRHKIALRLAQVVTLLLFMLAILSGFLGTQNISFNFNMTFFWIVFF